MVDFDSVHSGEPMPNGETQKPLWQLPLDDKDKEKTVLDWVNAELDYLQRENEDRIREIKHNLARYRGIQYQTLDTRSGNRDREQERAKFSPKMVINYLANVSAQRVSRLVKFKPSVMVLPQHDEIKDKQAAKNAKAFLDHVQNIQKYEKRNLQTLQMADICGEGYLDIVWNPDDGPYHPAYKRGQKIPLLDENGKRIVDSKGEDVMVEDPVYIGDVNYKLILPLHIFFEKRLSYEEAQYAFIIERVKVASLQRKYPNKAAQIKAEVSKTFYNMSKLEDEKLVNECFKVTLQYKRCPEMPEGRQIVFTKDVILENKELPYEHGDFSFERMPGIEIPGEQHAYSWFSRAKGIQAQFNNLTNMVIRNQMLVSHPKWFVPRGAVKLESLGNDITVVQYQGGVPPTLGQQNPTPAEVFNFRQVLKEELMNMGEIGDVLRGQPPAGITSGVALTFVAEQEREIANSQVLNYNEFVRRVAEKTLKVCGQYYEKSDKRTMLVLGKNKNWVNSEFDPQTLSRPFDVKIQNSASLPDSKAARMQLILDYAQAFPGMFPQEQVAEMLDLGQSEKFLTDAAAAARSAEAENENLLDGKEVDEPADYESHLVHWAIHFKAMQDSSFKKMPEEIQQAVKDHLLATEYLIFEQGKKNPGILQQASMNTAFPVFYEPPPPPIPEGPMPPMEGELTPEMMGGEPMPMDAMSPDGMPAPDLSEITPMEELGAMSGAPGGGFEPIG